MTLATDEAEAPQYKLEIAVTDQPPTDLDEVVITGQRARGTSPFSPLQFPSKGNIDNPDEQQEVEDGPGGGGTPSDETVQCSFPAGRRQWNTDAKARQAQAAFLLKAGEFGENHLQNREFGALLCEVSPGVIEFGPIQSGTPAFDINGVRVPGGGGSVPIPQDGCGSATPVGWVHSHPGLGTGVPSGADFGYTQQLVDYHGAPVTAGIYVISEYQDAQSGAYKTGVARSSLSDQENASAQNYQPAFVDPDATPCPGDT